MKYRILLISVLLFSINIYSAPVSLGKVYSIDLAKNEVIISPNRKMLKSIRIGDEAAIALQGEIILLKVTNTFSTSIRCEIVSKKSSKLNLISKGLEVYKYHRKYKSDILKANEINTEKPIGKIYSIQKVNNLVKVSVQRNYIKKLAEHDELAVIIDEEIITFNVSAVGKATVDCILPAKNFSFINKIKKRMNVYYGVESARQAYHFEHSKQKIKSALAVAKIKKIKSKKKISIEINQSYRGNVFLNQKLYFIENDKVYYVRINGFDSKYYYCSFVEYIGEGKIENVDEITKQLKSGTALYVDRNDQINLKTNELYVVGKIKKEHYRTIQINLNNDSQFKITRNTKLAYVHEGYAYVFKIDEVKNGVAYCSMIGKSNPLEKKIFRTKKVFIYYKGLEDAATSEGTDFEKDDFCC